MLLAGCLAPGVSAAQAPTPPVPAPAVELSTAAGSGTVGALSEAPAPEREPLDADEPEAEPAPSGPTFSFEGRLIGGFEYERTRLSGAQTGTAGNEYGFDIRQARMEMTGQLKPFRVNLGLDLSDAFDTDLAAVNDSPPFVRTITLEYRPSRSFRLVVGRFKRPFSWIQLESAVDLPVIRRGLFNDLGIEDNEWGDRAVGILASGRIDSPKLRWYVSLTNPSGSTDLASEGIDVLGRVELSPVRGIRVGVNGGYKYLRLGLQRNVSHSRAIGGEVELKVGEARLALEGSFADLPFENGRPEGFGLLLLADYELSLSADLALQPVVFAELADANASVSQSESVRLAFGVNLLAAQGFRVLPQVALVRSVGDTSQENPWLEGETYSLIFSLAL